MGVPGMLGRERGAPTSFASIVNEKRIPIRVISETRHVKENNDYKHQQGHPA